MQMKDKMVFDVDILASNKIMATTARKTTTIFFFLILLPIDSRVLFICLFVVILTQAGDMQNHTLIVVTNLKR